MWEATLLSITPSFAERAAKENPILGTRIKDFKDNIDKPLSAILTLNTIAHTVGAIGVGAQAATIWNDTYVFGINVAAVVVPVVMTLAILIISEIIPKTIGANSWRSLAGFTVNSLHYIIMILYPLVWLSQQITKTLKKEKDKSVLSRADFYAMAEIADQGGAFRKVESRIIKSLMQFQVIKAKDIMTPRTVVLAGKADMSIHDFFDQYQNTPFSRVPIYEGTKDNIVGFVLKLEVWAQLIKGHKDKPLSDFRREILVVNEQMSLPDLYNQMIEKREQIALVVDEYGGMAGLATMEDVVETLLDTEIVDESDSTTDMQTLARQNWEKRARKLGILEAD